MSNIFQTAGKGNLAPLYAAAHCGYLNVADALIRAGAPLNVPEERYSPLHGAVIESHHDMAAMLLREGAEVDSRAYHQTPLSYAKDRRMAALLIAAGADVNSGRLLDPLHWAALYGRLGVLEELLSHPDIEVNKQDTPYQRTALYYAVAFCRIECLAALLAAGADVSITDAEGRTPLLYCFADDGNDSKFRIIVMLVAAGNRQWAHVPSPCPGLEAVLLSVWKEAPDELGQLFSHLEDPVKRRIQAALCTMHHASPRHLPDHICMRLLDEAFHV